MKILKILSIFHLILTLVIKYLTHKKKYQILNNKKIVYYFENDI